MFLQCNVRYGKLIVANHNRAKVVMKTSIKHILQQHYKHTGQVKIFVFKTIKGLKENL